MNMAQFTAALWPLGVKPDAWLRPLRDDELRAAADALREALRAARREASAAKARASAARLAKTRAATKAANNVSRAAASARLKERGYGAVTTEILQLLLDAPQGLTSGAIKKALGGVRVAGHLASMHSERGQVERASAPGAYVYTITAKGRQTLALVSKVAG